MMTSAETKKALSNSHYRFFFFHSYLNQSESMAPQIKFNLHDPINHQKLYDHLKANCRDLLVDYQLRIQMPKAILHSFIYVTYPYTRRSPKELEKKRSGLKSYLHLKKNIDANRELSEYKVTKLCQNLHPKN